MFNLMGKTMNTILRLKCLLNLCESVRPLFLVCHALVHSKHRVYCACSFELSHLGASNEHYTRYLHLDIDTRISL